MASEKSAMNRKQQMFSNGFYDDIGDDESHSDSCEEDDENNFKYQIENTLSLEDCVVEGRGNNWKHVNSADKNLGTEFEVLDIPSEYKEEIDIFKLLKDGYTYISTDVEMHDDWVFDEQVLELESNERITVKRIDDRRVSVDLGRLLWNEVVTESCLFVFIQQMDKRKMNYLISSTIPCHPIFKNPVVWSEKLKSKSSILETVEYIATGFSENVNIVGSLKKVSNFFKNQRRKGHPFGYSEKLESEWEWKYPLYLKLPNENDHKSWAYGLFSSNIGKREEWTKVWKRVSEEVDGLLEGDSLDKDKSIGSSSKWKCERCGCAEKHRLYEMNEGLFKCDGCVKKHFYTELRIGRVPVKMEFKLQKGSSSLDILTAIIPLPILNFYVTMVYKQCCQSDNIQTCPFCKSVLIFDNVSKWVHSGNSCPCGYTWCSKCLEVPHWPMTCAEFEQWNQNWQWKYGITKAVGKPERFVARVICCCQNSLFYTGTMETVCPVCDSTVVLDNFWRPQGFAMERIYYKYGRKNKKNTRPKPVLMDSMMIDQLPVMNKNVLMRCSDARSDRFDLEVLNKFRVKNGTSQQLKNISQTILYLAENVTAWLFIRKDSDQNIEKMLKQLIVNRELLTHDESKRVPVFYEKLEADIRKLINLVEESRKNTPS